MSRRILPWILPVTLIVVWEAVSRAGLVQAYLLPPPSAIAATIVDLAQTGALVRHVTLSLARVAAGYAVGAALGAFLGLVVGVSRRTEALVDGLLQATRSVPSLAWVPLLVLWMGIGESPKITLIAIGAFFPVYLALVSAVRAVDPKLVELGRAYGLGRTKIITRIVAPSTIPALFSGLRTSLAVSWLYVVAAELIAANSGLGFLLSDGRELSRADLIFASIVLLAVCGRVTDTLLKIAEARLLRWRPVLDVGGDQGQAEGEGQP